MQCRLAPSTDEGVGEVGEKVSFMIAVGHAAAQAARQCGSDEAVKHRGLQRDAKDGVRHDVAQPRVLLRGQFLRGVSAAQGQSQGHRLQREAVSAGHQPWGVLNELPPVEPSQRDRDDQQGKEDSAHGRTGSRRGDKATVS